MHDVSERAWEDRPAHFIDNVMVISDHTGLFSISMSKMLKVQLTLLCIWCHNLKSINVMSSVGKGNNLFIKTDLLHFCSNCFKDTAETVGQHSYLCHHCCPVGTDFPSYKSKTRRNESQVHIIPGYKTAVSAHIHIGKAKHICCSHQGKSWSLPMFPTQPATEEQGELLVPQTIHQHRLDVLKLGDLCWLLLSDTFSMSICYVFNTLSCSLRWL